MPIRTALVWLLALSLAQAQQNPANFQNPQQRLPPGLNLPQPTALPPAPAPANPAAPVAASPAPQATAPATRPPVQASSAGGLNLTNISLVEVIDILARWLKINYILDPRVKGSVTINTYGEIKPIDVRQLLETILRMNGAAIVQVGDLYRIVPLSEVSRLPIRPKINGKDLPDDEQMLLNLVFLKYATVADLAKLLEPFLGESAKMIPFDPANLLLILDNARNMRRTMELISLFDNDMLASQRVRLFEVENGRPTDIVKELETVFKAFALSEKSASVKFMPIDRINTIIAVAPNPGVFPEVVKWLEKLDVPVKITAGSIDNYVYKLKYGRAEILGAAVMQLYGGGGGYGGYGGGGYGGGGYGAYGGGFGGGMGLPGMGGMGSFGGGGGGGMGLPGIGQTGPVGGPLTAPIITNTTPGIPGSQVPPGQPGTMGAGGGMDQTGSYIGYPGSGYRSGPRIIPNPFDNTLLVQGTPQEWEQIKKLLEQLDVAPRQVLIDAKIYEVTLSGALAGGVSSFLQRRGAAASVGSGENSVGLSRFVEAAASASGLVMTGGFLVGKSRELLSFLSAQEDTRRSKVIAAPSIIATDSITASINVGTEVPTLSSQAVSPIQSGGSSLFTNTVANRNTGVTLNILARVNASGIVTLVINQEVSAPQAPAASSSIQSPSFSKRNVSTQVTVQDGDTIAIGGIIQETDTSSSSGIPYLHRLPVVGAAFGSKSTSKQRTELVVFMTPRVIYDTNEITEASDELKSKLRRLTKMIKE